MFLKKGSTIVVLLLVFYQNTNSQSVDVSKRVDCYPEPGASQDACQSRGCIWTEAPVREFSVYPEFIFETL